MSAVKSIIDTSIAVQSAGLLAHNYQASRDVFRNKIKARNGVKRIVNLGVTNIVGISLLKEQANLAASL